MVIEKRGKNAAVAGAAGQALFAAAMLAIGLWTGSPAAMACAYFLAGGVLLWLMVALLLYVRQLESQEAMELEELARGTAKATIFEGATEADLRPAAHRRAWVQRWLVPAFTLLWAAFHATIGVVMLRYLLIREALPVRGPAEGMVFSILVTFLAFLYSRYSTGMSRRDEWRPLRAAGSYMLAGAIFAGATAVAFGTATQEYTAVGYIVAHVIPAIQLVLALEMALNFVMDLYRPRLPGQPRHLSFDSRLLGFVAEPGRVGRSIAETINYQFGFEVSKTWFYQLLSRAFVPLLVLAGVVLFAMSCIVVVGEGQQAVVLHWGSPDTSNSVRGPGIGFKWPWPIDTVRTFQTGRIHEIVLGVGQERSEAERQAAIISEGTFAGREQYLWTEEHGRRKELDFLLAVPPDRERTVGAEAEQRPPVNIIRLVVPVQYRITDVYKYGYRFVDAGKLLEDVAYREMVRYCASATLNSPVADGAADRPEAIMTYGRQHAAAELKERIQEVADRLDLGVEITYVGLLSVHPPPEAAEAFEDVLKAERRQDELRYRAEAEANEILARVAGDPSDALELAMAIRRLGELSSLAGLRDKPQAFAHELADYIARTGEDIRSLDEEIDRERLLGQIRPGKPTANQRLRQAYQSYLDVLVKLKSKGDSDLPAQLANARVQADALFGKAAGGPAAEVAKAVADRWQAELVEQSRAELFTSELLAYKASPNIYRLDRWLDVLDKVLPGAAKYVLTVDREKFEIWLNWERQGGLMEGVRFEGEQGK